MRVSIHVIDSQCGIAGVKHHAVEAAGPGLFLAQILVDFGGCRGWVAEVKEPA